MTLSPSRRAGLTAKAQSFAAHIKDAESYLLSRGISVEAASMFGLGSVPFGQEHGGRLCIPYYTPAGVVHMKYRCADMSHGDHKGEDVECPKYLYEAGLGIHLYNAQVLINADDKVVVTEGEIDAICVQAYCGFPSVAYPGVESWKSQAHFPLCFEGVPEVIVIADGDRPGRQSALRVAESIGSSARVVELGDGYDANSWIAEKGAISFSEKLLN